MSIEKGMRLRVKNDAEAVDTLGHETFSEDGGLYNLGAYIGWNMRRNVITLDGLFTIEELEAIVYWMRTYGPKEVGG